MVAIELTRTTMYITKLILCMQFISIISFVFLMCKGVRYNFSILRFFYSIYTICFAEFTNYLNKKNNPLYVTHYFVRYTNLAKSRSIFNLDFIYA